MSAFAQQNVGFLDFPGFEFPKGKLSEAKDLIQRIAKSEKLAEDLRAQARGAKIKEASGRAPRPTKKRGRNGQAIINFYEVAKPGDFVVLPEPLHLSNVWVGRFASPKIVDAFAPRYDRVPIPARDIDWIGKYPENSVSTGLSKSLRNQHPFTLLERSNHLEVFSLAYGSFVHGDHHAATVYNDRDDFLDSDAAFLGVISRLASAAVKSLDESRTNLTPAALLDVLVREPPIEYTCSQEADIHSPGFTRYISAAIVALVIAAVAAGLVGLSTYSTKETLADDVAKLSFVNSGSNADPQCTARVSEASKRVLLALGTDRTWALCEAARNARNRAGMRSSATPIQKVDPPQSRK
ncbi:hypothetical protein [Tardiphaga sp. OK245]|uniref:hypothetical protein n=1 Tax=Tardiphaga sp. OK245 TaxID=1855306 RepID=UPI000B8A17ED|nr:hypothetical protein [Tardiphaga sp. OK245]